MTEVQFNKLYKEYKTLVERIAYKFYPFFSKDIAQEVWLNIFLKYDVYKEKGVKDEVLIRVIAKSRAIDFIRIYKQHQTLDNIDIIEDSIDNRDLDIEILSLRELIREIILEIPDEKTRTIAILYYLRNMNHEEILLELSILDYNIKKNSLYRYIHNIKSDILNRVKNYKKEDKLKLDFQLGDE